MPLLLLEFKDYCLLFSCCYICGPKIFDSLQRLHRQSLGKRMYAVHMIFLFDSFMCHKASFQCVITIPRMLQSLRSQLKVTRSGAMKQSEVTHIVMQWRGFFFFYLWVSFSVYPFCLLYFNFYFPLPPLCTLCFMHGGGRCMPVPRWRVEWGEINSEGVWSFLKDFPGKTLLSGW